MFSHCDELFRSTRSNPSLIATGETERKIKPPKRSIVSKAVLGCMLGVSLQMNHAESATILVDSNVSGSGCTFEKAFMSVDLQALQPGCNASGILGTDDTIQFDDQLTNAVVRTREEVQTSNTINITIDASDIAGGISIEANNVSPRIMRFGFFSDNSEITFNNVSIRGAVIVRGNSSITLIDSVIHDSRSGLSNRAALNVIEGSLELVRCKLRENEPRGIALEVGASATVTNSLISNNASRHSNGAGIYVKDSILTMTDSIVSNNSTYDNGGGIAVVNNQSVGLQASVLIQNSSIYGNSSMQVGGGIFSDSSPVSIHNTTVRNNTADQHAGGIGVQPNSGFNYDLSLVGSTISNNVSVEGAGGIYSSAGTIINSTISGNMVTDTSAGYGGGIVTFSATGLTLLNTTIANNTAFRGGGMAVFFNGAVTLNDSIIADSSSIVECYQSIGTSAISNAGTIVEDGSCGASRAIDPKLAPLAFNGGSTRTHALLPDSPAINTASGSCFLTDQRGRPRDDGQCDVGAFEYGPGDQPSDFYVIPLKEKKTVVVPL